MMQCCVLLVFLKVLLLGNCNNFVKRRIFVLNETKQDEILLKLKVLELENLHGIPFTFVKLWTKVAQLSAIFKCMNES